MTDRSRFVRQQPNGPEISILAVSHTGCTWPSEMPDAFGRSHETILRLVLQDVPFSASLDSQLRSNGGLQLDAFRIPIDASPDQFDEHPECLHVNIAPNGQPLQRPASPTSLSTSSSTTLPGERVELANRHLLRINAHDAKSTAIQIRMPSFRHSCQVCSSYRHGGARPQSARYNFFLRLKLAFSWPALDTAAAKLQNPASESTETSKNGRPEADKGNDVEKEAVQSESARPVDKDQQDLKVSSGQPSKRSVNVTEFTYFSPRFLVLKDPRQAPSAEKYALAHGLDDEEHGSPMMSRASPHPAVYPVYGPMGVPVGMPVPPPPSMEMLERARVQHMLMQQQHQQYQAQFMHPSTRYVQQPAYPSQPRIPAPPPVPPQPDARAPAPAPSQSWIPRGPPSMVYGMPSVHEVPDRSRPNSDLSTYASMQMMKQSQAQMQMQLQMEMQRRMPMPMPMPMSLMPVGMHGSAPPVPMLPPIESMLHREESNSLAGIAPPPAKRSAFYRPSS